MSIQENAEALNGAVELLGEAVSQAGAAQETGGQGLVAIQAVAGDSPPSSLQEALETASAAQHSIEEAIGTYTESITKVQEYVSTLMS